MIPAHHIFMKVKGEKTDNYCVKGRRNTSEISSLFCVQIKMSQSEKGEKGDNECNKR